MVQDDFKNAGSMTTGELTPEMLALINARMFPEFPVVPTDVGFALGSGVMSALIAKTAKGYYDKKLIARIILSGGAVVNDIPETKHFLPLLQQYKIPAPRDGQTEAEYMQDILWASGIPENTISIEDGAINTGDNIALSSLYLQEPGVSATLFCLPLGPRPLMTWRKHFPIMLGSDPAKWQIANPCYVYPPGLTKDNWHRDPSVREIMVREFWKISPENSNNYFVKGFCFDTPMDVEQELVKSLAPNAPKNSRVLAARKLRFSRGPTAL